MGRRPIPVSADRATSHGPAHPREKPGFSTSARYFSRETDCLLEGDGFELSVPLRSSVPYTPKRSFPLSAPSSD
jgi:hypothetical protein